MDNPHCIIRRKDGNAGLFEQIKGIPPSPTFTIEGPPAREEGKDLLYIHHRLPDGTFLRGAITRLSEHMMDLELLVRGGTIETLEVLISALLESLQGKVSKDRLLLEFVRSDCEPEAP